MQATKIRSNFSATASRSNSVSDLLATAFGVLAIGLLVAGASLPQRASSRPADRAQAALVQSAQPTAATVARSVPAPTQQSR